MVALISPFVAFVGLEDYGSRAADHQRHMQQRVLDRQNEQRLIPGFQSDRSLRALRTPSALSILVRGLDNQLPPYWDMSPAGPTAGQPNSEVTGVQERNVTLDLEFLLRIILGFLALTLGAETVALDRQRGTLKILFSQPLPGQAIAFAKLLSGSGVLLLGLTLMWATSMSVLALTAPALLTAEFIGVSIGLLAVGFIYLMTLFAGGMIIGQNSRSYYSANVTASITWLAISFVLIPVMAFVARGVTNAPNRSAFEAARDEQFNALTRSVEEGLGARLREAIGPAADPRSVTIHTPVGSEIDRLWSERMAASQMEMAALTAKATLERTRRQQWARALAVANPAALLLEATADLAGTGTMAAQQVEAAVDQYQLALDAAVFRNRPRIHLRVPSDRGVSLEAIERRPVPKVSELPSFVEHTPRWSARLKDSIGVLSVLLIYAIVASGLTCAMFQYKPTSPFRSP
jgi:ABC-2 type transport system permease protein